MSHAQRDLRILCIVVPIWVAAFYFGFDADWAMVGRLWYVLPLSFVAAAFANATAVGGGFVFIPLWMFVFHLSPLDALKLSLATEAVGMTCGAAEWGKERMIPKLIGIVIVVSSIGVVIGTFLLKPTPILIKGVFGVVSMAMGLLTLKMINFHGTNDEPSKVWMFYPAALLGGLISSWISIGSGAVISVLLMLVYKVRATKAIGLGVLALSANAILATVLHVSAGDMSPKVWELLMFTAPAVVFGSRFGVRVGARIGQRRLKITFAAVAIVDGFLMFAVVLHGLLGSH